MVPMCSDYILKKRLEAYGFKWYHRSDTWHEEPYILQSCGSAFIFWESGSSLNNCVRNYHFKEFSGVEKDITNCSKEKKPMKLQKYFIKNYRTNFLAFFHFFPQMFPLWIRVRILNADPDPRGKMNADSWGSGSTDLMSFTGIVLVYILKHSVAVTRRSGFVPWIRFRTLIRSPIFSVQRFWS